MTTRTITGTIVDYAGDPISGAGVSFVMNDGAYLLDPDETYMAGGITAVTNSSGVFSVELASGLPITWSVRLPGGDSFVIAVPTGAATTLEELRSIYNGTVPERVPGDPPTVTDFTNAQHTHLAAATGGTLSAAAIGSGVLGTARLGSGTPGVTNYLRGDGAWTFPPYVTVFNVKDPEYGAVGDGTTDDRAAINSAITAASNAGGGIVFLPKGTYAASARISLAADVRLVGAGPNATIIKATGDDVILITTGAHRAVIRDLAIDGNRTAAGSVNRAAISGSASDYIVVDNVHVYNTSGIGIGPRGAHARILNCRLTDIGTSGNTAAHAIYSDTVPGGLVHGCYVDGCEGDGIGGTTDQILSDNYVRAAKNSGIYVGADFERVRIEGNVCVLCENYGIDVTFATTNANYGAVITGNTCAENWNAGIGCASNGAVITGNTCYGNGNDAAISGSPASAWPYGILIDGRNMAVTGNTCSDAGSGNQDYGIFVRYLSASSGTLADNVILGNALAGNVVGAINLGTTTGSISSDVVNSGSALILGNAGYREHGKHGVRIFDHFLKGLAGSSNILGDGWHANGTSTGTRSIATPTAGRPGLVTISTGATSGSTSYLRLFNAGFGVFLPAERFDVRFAFRLQDNDANVTMRVGLSNDGSSNPSSDGIYIEKLDADTQWFAVTRASSTETRSSALASCDTNWHDIRIRRINTTTIGFTLDSGTEVTLATNVPTAALQPFYFIANSAAANKRMQIDWFEGIIEGLA